MLLFLQTVFFCILKGCPYPWLLASCNTYNVNVKPLRWMGREAERKSWRIKPLLLCFCQCLVHSPSPARNSDSWWSVPGTKLDARKGVRTSNLCIVVAAHVGFKS